MAGPARFERATLCLEGRCSIRLSYGPLLLILSAQAFAGGLILPRRKQPLFTVKVTNRVGALGAAIPAISNIEKCNRNGGSVQ